MWLSRADFEADLERELRKKPIKELTDAEIEWLMHDKPIQVHAVSCETPWDRRNGIIDGDMGLFSQIRQHVNQLFPELFPELVPMSHAPVRTAPVMPARIPSELQQEGAPTRKRRHYRNPHWVGLKEAIRNLQKDGISRPNYFQIAAEYQAIVPEGDRARYLQVDTGGDLVSLLKVDDDKNGRWQRDCDKVRHGT